jgi:hypothetical protein
MIPVCGCTVGGAHSTVGATMAAHQASDPMTAATAPSGDAPGVYGSRLHVPPGESAAALALALSEQLAASKTENGLLAAQGRGLEAELEAKDKALARATADVGEARAELTSARIDLERWEREIVSMREKLEAADKENLATLQTTVALLQQLLAREGPSTGE